MDTSEARIAYHLIWTTYGTWLPGDARGWVEEGKPGVQPGNPHRERLARSHMNHGPTYLTEAHRAVVEATVRDHCAVRGWTLHAVHARSNHVHVVVTAGLAADRALAQLKAWCSCRLSEQTPNPPPTWWTKEGTRKPIWDEAYLQNAIEYVLERQG